MHDQTAEDDVPQIQDLQLAESTISEPDLRTALDALFQASLRPVAAGLGVLYVVLALAYPFLLPGTALAPLLGAASGTAIAFCALYYALGQRALDSRWIYFVGLGVVGLVLLNNLLYARAKPEHAAASMIFLVIGSGLFLLATRWFALALALTLAGWGWLDWGPDWATLALATTAFTTCLHVLRLQTLRRAETSRSQVAFWQADAESMLQMLQRSEARFYQLSEASFEGIAIHVQGTVLEANQALALMFGYERFEIIGESLLNFAAPESRDLIAQNMAAQYDEPFEVFGLRKDGAKFPMQVCAKSIPYQGQTAHLVAARDITQRKLIERQLKATTQQLIYLFENLEQVLFSIDLVENRLLQISPACARVIGYPPQAFYDDPALWHKVVHPDDRDSATPDVHSDMPTSGTYRILRPDGETRWVEFKINPTWNSAGRATRLDGVLADVTQRQQAEQALRESENKFRTLSETMMAAIFIYRDGRLLYVNPAAAALTGYTQAELQEMNFWDIIHPDFQTMVKTWSMSRQQGDELTQRYEAKILTRGGQERWTDFTGGLIEYQGQPAALETAFDISQRKQAEQALAVERALLAERVAGQTAELRVANAELARAARLKDEFLANMSHELRTPLNAILGLSEVLQEQIYGALTEQQLNALHIIEESGRHLLELINDILDLSKIGAGKLELDIVPTSVQAICQASLRMIKQPAHKKRIRVHSNLDATATSLLADARRAKQVLVNLLSNAVKFTPEGGDIGLDVVGDAGREVIHFSVWDTGIGIAEQDIDRLFQPFVQLDSRLDRRYEGTGLGLVLVYRLTEMQGGSVSVESAPGQGSRFTVSLPCPQKIVSGELEPPDEAKRLAAPEAPRQALILLAEDNQTSAVATSDYLTAHGYRVIMALDGAQAVVMAQQEQPDVILMDIQMPVMDGLEAIQLIRADADVPEIPIIALTALAMPGDRERCLASGADEYLSKPVNLKMLLETIEAQKNLGHRQEQIDGFQEK